MSRRVFSILEHILLSAMLKKLALMSMPLLLLTGCSLEEVAQTAGDATACTALQGTLSTLQDAYAQGIVDSGVLQQVDDLIGNQLDALLSTSMVQDLRQLSQELSATDSAQAASERIGSLTSSITERCSAVGVNVE
jgi:hypothetical protein